jgi:AraC family transcriptional regulator
VNEPGLRMRGIFRSTFDVLHLHVPNAIIADYTRSERGQTRTIPLIADRLAVDPVVERLARYLIRADELGGVLGQSYADGISLAIIAHLFGENSNPAPSNPHRMSSRSKWRLKRATEYMSAKLAHPVSLADIATAAELSRMHFAAQFRASTGLHPHDYLLQQRIEPAQVLLFGSHLPLVEVAVEVGFKTQAHFTSVFSRVVVETSNAWRQRNRDAPVTPVLDPDAGHIRPGHMPADSNVRCRA